MVAEVNKIIAGELLGHRAVTISGVGTLYVAHRGARRLSRRQIAAPRNEVEFRSSEDGVALAELIRRAAGCDAAQAQAIFERWAGEDAHRRGADPRGDRHAASSCFYGRSGFRCAVESGGR